MVPRQAPCGSKISRPARSHPRRLINAYGTLYFAAAVENRLELWRSDGTEAGTYPVSNGPPEAPGTYVEELTLAGDKLFFVGQDAAHGREVFKLDLAPGA